MYPRMPLNQQSPWNGQQSLGDFCMWGFLMSVCVTVPPCQSNSVKPLAPLGRELWYEMPTGPLPWGSSRTSVVLCSSEIEKVERGPEDGQLQHEFFPCLNGLAISKSWVVPNHLQNTCNFNIKFLRTNKSVRKEYYRLTSYYLYFQCLYIRRNLYIFLAGHIPFA